MDLKEKLSEFFIGDDSSLPAWVQFCLMSEPEETIAAWEQDDADNLGLGIHSDDRAWCHNIRVIPNWQFWRKY